MDLKGNLDSYDNSIISFAKREKPTEIEHVESDNRNKLSSTSSNLIWYTNNSEKELNEVDKRHVLSEEDFVYGLGRIIENNYYPDLKKLRKSVLNANEITETKNEAIFFKNKNAEFITFDSASGINEFHSAFTSEDNYSFNYMVHYEGLKKANSATKGSELLFLEDKKSQIAASIKSTSLATVNSDKSRISTIDVHNDGINAIEKFKNQQLVKKNKIVSDLVETGNFTGKAANTFFNFEYTPIIKPRVTTVNQLDDHICSPIMTWGKIDSTPIPVDSSTGDRPIADLEEHFVIPEMPLADKTMHKLLKQKRKRNVSVILERKILSTAGSSSIIRSSGKSSSSLSTSRNSAESTSSSKLSKKDKRLFYLAQKSPLISRLLNIDGK